MSSHWLRQTSSITGDTDLMDRLLSDGLTALALLLCLVTQVGLSNPIIEDNWGTFWLLFLETAFVLYNLFFFSQKHDSSLSYICVSYLVHPYFCRTVIFLNLKVSSLIVCFNESVSKRMESSLDTVWWCIEAACVWLGGVSRWPQAHLFAVCIYACANRGCFLFCNSLPCVCVFPSGLVPAVWQPLCVPQLCASVPTRSPPGAGWLPVLLGVRPAAGWALHPQASLRRSERAAVRLQCQFPRRARRMCRWVPDSKFHACVGRTDAQSAGVVFKVCSAEQDSLQGGRSTSASICRTPVDSVPVMATVWVWRMADT